MTDANWQFYLNTEELNPNTDLGEVGTEEVVLPTTDLFR
jgi:hypothetical protein